MLSDLSLPAPHMAVWETRVARTTRPTLGQTVRATSGSINVSWISLTVSGVQMTKFLSEVSFLQLDSPTNVLLVDICGYTD